MKNKRFIIKILIDIDMTVCLLLLMPYSLLSETAHEWIGMTMFVLFIAHHILNCKWLTAINKGKYNLFRIIQTILVIIMFILMMGSMISGILLSNHIFKGLKISGSYMTARQIHMFCAYWGLVVMLLHLGLHYSKESLMRAREAANYNDEMIRVGISPMTPPEIFVELWPKIQEIYPDMKFKFITFENTPENAREIPWWRI